MSTFPEQVPHNPEQQPSGEPTDSPASDPLGPENVPIPPAEWTGEPEEPSPQPGSTSTASLAAPDDQPLFASYTRPELIALREERIPHMGHIGILILLVFSAFVAINVLVAAALHAKLWGISTPAQAQTDFHYALITQAALYLITFAGCLIAFPLLWRKSFFDGIHWNGAFAIQRFARLVSAAVICFFVAMINGMLLPGPTDAPIDQLFKAPGAAWVLFAFGVTLAPFFEEMAFRGFLLPALCTAWDWSLEHLTGTPRRPLDQNGDPNWSLNAMIFGSLITSLPFALMHGFQTAWSLGPFLLLVFVSLVLCWVRLSTRSLAASTLVHASYNFMLFSFMLLGTGGFKHLDKM
ncbi:CPBP family intramembrane glutamic endopeptidase [Occallatibacter savannae]|uniref:CPBP family intramembrane glutamic endopeptidase n=1 Tax=Occallatibacter savannae TaxID=1002691 RepID=UPI000D687C60|nr:type II CAAX endopeptidase family protein [Occallatibacter savannae]